MSRVLSGAGVVLPAAAIALGLALVAAYSPLAGVALMGAVGLAVAVAARPQWLLILLVGCFPWRGLLSYPSDQVSVVKILGVLLVFAFLLSALAQGRTLKLPPAVLAAGLLGFCVVTALAFSADPVGSLSKTLRYLLFIVFFFVLVQLVEERGEIVRLIRVFVLSSTLAAAWALNAFLLKGDIARAAGPIEQPVDFGFLLVAAIPLCGYLVLQDRGRRWLWSVCLVLLSGAMLATLSRGAIVGISSVLIWAVATRRIPFRGVMATAVTIVGVAVLAFTFWSPLIHERLKEKHQVAGKNVESRKALWAAGRRIALDHPLIGIGADRFGPTVGTYVLNDPIQLRNPAIHNAYLEILVEAGIVALVAFLAYLALAWRALSRAYRRAREAGDEDGWRLASAIQGSLVAIIVSALFLSQQLAVPFWLLGGLAVALAGATSAAASRAPEPARPPALRPAPA